MEKIDDLFGPIEEPKRGLFGKAMHGIFRSRRLNLFSIFLIVAVSSMLTFLAFAGGQIGPIKNPIGAAVFNIDKKAETALLPKMDCLCPECAACPELDCTTCPAQIINNTETITILSYACENGTVMNASEDCKKKETASVSSSIAAKSKGVLFSIDGLGYIINADGTGYIKQLNYTITNEGSKIINPIILFKIYPTGTSSSDVQRWNTNTRLR